MALYLKELAVLETTTNTLVKLTNVMEGVDGAATFGYNVEQVAVKVNGNQTLPYLWRHTLDIRISDDATPATQAILTAWANAPETYRFKASGYGGDTFLLWDEPVTMLFVRQRDGIAVRRMLMTLDAVPGFTGTAPLDRMPVYAGQNLMGIFKPFTGSAQFMNGITSTASVDTAVFNSPNQTLALGTNGFVAYGPFLFPFDDVTLTMSVNMTAVASPFFTGRMRYLNSAQALISSSDVSLSSATRRSVTGNTATGTYYIQPYIASNGLGDSNVFNTPCIRLGAGESAWTP